MTGGPYYAGDVGVPITFGPLETGEVDGEDLTSARVVAVLRDMVVELPVSFAAQAVDSVTLRHVTTGSLATHGVWRVRAFYYQGATLVLASSIAELPVFASVVPQPS